MSLDLNGTTGLTFNNGSTQDVGGVGTGSQTWQNVAASRALNTTYTNTTGKPISVSVTLTAGTSLQAALTIGGVSIIGNYGISGVPSFVCGIVPNGSAYSVGGGSTVQYWTELR